MTILVLFITCALGLAGWVAIVKLLGWWVAGALAYLFLLVAAIASIGGINAALLWLERRRRG